MKIRIVTQHGVFRRCDCCKESITPQIRHVYDGHQYLGAVHACARCLAKKDIGWSTRKGKAVFVDKGCEAVA